MADLRRLGVALERDAVDGGAVDRRGAEGGERRVEAGEVVEGGAGAEVLVALEDHLAGRRIPDREQAAVEEAVLDRRRRPALRLAGEAVDVLAREPLEGGDQVGADPLGHLEDLGPQVGVVAVEPRPVGAHRHPRHRLDAAGDRHLLLAAHHPGGGEVHRLDAGAAEAVEGDAGDLLGPAGGEDGVAGDVRPLLLGLGDAADDHVLDVAAFEAGALGEPVQGLGEELLGVDSRQRPLAFLAAAAGGADRVDDPRFAHEISPGITTAAAGRTEGCRRGGSSGPPGGCRGAPAP